MMITNVLYDECIPGKNFSTSGSRIIAVTEGSSDVDVLGNPVISRLIQLALGRMIKRRKTRRHT
jgi:predicted nucleotidyltransferase